MEHNNILGTVLAGGKSQRFGEDKSQILLADKILIDYILADGLMTKSVPALSFITAPLTVRRTSCPNLPCARTRSAHKDAVHPRAPLAYAAASDPAG